MQVRWEIFDHLDEVTTGLSCLKANLLGKRDP